MILRRRVSPLVEDAMLMLHSPWTSTSSRAAARVQHLRSPERRASRLALRRYQSCEKAAQEKEGLDKINKL